MPRDESSFKIGTKIGPYTVLDAEQPQLADTSKNAITLGKGASAEVCLVEQTLTAGVTIDRALKYYAPNSKILERRKEAGLSAGKESFIAEIKAISSFNHQNLVKVIDAGLYVGQPYFVMEYVDGPPLLDLFSPEYPQFAVWKSRAQEDPYLVLRMARQLCWPIAYLHSYRFFHFDIAPKNIFVREVGQKPHMILGDLGVGQTVPGLDDPSLKTMLGIFVGGTREYTPAILHEYLNFKEKKLAPAPLLAKYAQFWDVFAIATVLEDMIKAWDLSEHRDLVATKILCKRAKNFEEGFDALRLTNELERLLPAQVLTAGVEELSSDAVGKRTNVAIPLYSVSLSDRVEQIVQSTRLFSTTAAAESDEDILRAIAGVEWDIAVGPLHPFYDACGRISRYFATLLFLWHSLPVVDRGERQIYFDHAIRGRAAFQQHYLTCPRCLLADEKDGIIASGATS